jgi:hypothetical protein
MMCLLLAEEAIETKILADSYKFYLSAQYFLAENVVAKPTIS